MARRNVSSRPRAGGSSSPPPQPAPFIERWYGKLALLLLTITLSTLSFAPLGQFYLAWVALVPWLIVLNGVRSQRAAFLWSWLAGIGFFTANMWWIAFVTGPGMIALMGLLGLYWAVAGMVIRGAGLLRVRTDAINETTRARLPFTAGIFLIAAVWVAIEWARATWPLQGLPWLYLGHAQSPLLVLDQIADTTGVYGISFWVALINAWVAMLILNRRKLRPLIPAGLAVLAVIALSLGYGVFRLGQKTMTPGPVVLVVQPNYPQSNTGEKGASYKQIIEFHLRATREALAAHPGVNLVVWSETMMPPLNPEGRALAQDSTATFARVWQEAQNKLVDLSREQNVAILVGGLYYDRWTVRATKTGEEFVPQDRRNSAYFYRPHFPDQPRYDKIHLVPFGEYLPFKRALPPLYRLFLALSPYTEEYTLTAGSTDALTVFQLGKNWRFVTPICFEDIDPVLVARMFRPEPGGAGNKRADFIVNITNDGWFKYNEMSQHLQAGIFRSIENRVPTARSVNTGISGFIDSTGHSEGLIPAGIEGTSVMTLGLDSRLTFYTRFGDVFACTCAAATGILTIFGIYRWIKQCRHRRETPA